MRIHPCGVPSLYHIGAICAIYLHPTLAPIILLVKHLNSFL